jgi:hypothetical protein
MHIRGKKSSIPLFENVRQYSDSVAARLRDENPYSLNEDNRGNAWDSKSSKIVTNEDKENLVGYRAPRAGASFLAGLGKELATDKGNL